MPDLLMPNYSVFDPIWSCFIVVRLDQYKPRGF